MIIFENLWQLTTNRFCIWVKSQKEKTANNNFWLSFAVVYCKYLSLKNRFWGADDQCGHPYNFTERLGYFSLLLIFTQEIIFKLEWVISTLSPALSKSIFSLSEVFALKKSFSEQTGDGTKHKETVLLRYVILPYISIIYIIIQNILNNNIFKFVIMCNRLLFDLYRTTAHNRTYRQNLSFVQITKQSL